MKLKKSIQLGEGREQDLIAMFQRKLVETCGENSAAYQNNMKAFENMLQEVVDKAFQIGQEAKQVVYVSERDPSEGHSL